MQRKILNQIITITLLFLPLIAIAAWKFFPDQISAVFSKKFEGEISRVKLGLDLKDKMTSIDTSKVEPPLKLKHAEGKPTTDDIKGLGYTGQNKIAIDSKKNVYVAYRKKYQNNYEIYVSKYTPNKNGDLKLSSNVRVATVGKDSTQRVPSLAIDSKDILYIVWYGLDPEIEKGRQIKFSKSEDGAKTWSKWTNVSFIEGYNNQEYWQEHPHISVDSNGSLFVVWEGLDSSHTNQQIKFSKSGDGGKNWTSYKNVFPEPNVQSRPSIVITPDGNLNLFYYANSNNSGQKIKYLVSKDKGETWSQPVNISKNDGDSRHVTAISVKDKMLAFWRGQETTSSHAQIYFSEYKNNNWSDPMIASKNDRYQFFPSAGINHNNKVALVWMETTDTSDFPREDPEEGTAYAAIYDDSQKIFINKTKISGNSALYPHIALKNAYSESIFGVYESIEKNTILINVLSFNP